MSNLPGPVCTNGYVQGDATVMTVDLRQKQIRELRPGDDVMGTFGEINKVLDVRRVLYTGTMVKLFVGKNSILMTEHTRVISPVNELEAKFTRASDLQAGAYVIGPSINPVGHIDVLGRKVRRINKVQVGHFNGPVYGLMLANDQTYYGGFLGLGDVVLSADLSEISL